MIWQPLTTRKPPLIIAGPIVRRVEPDSVNIWVALSAADTITLRIFGPNDEDRGDNLSQAGAGQATVPLGERLHVALLTVNPHRALSPGEVYRYQLEFASVPAAGRQNFDRAIGPDGLAAICYEVAAGKPDTLPSFTLPPQDLSHVKIAHSSCRKAHGEQADAFPVLDNIIAATRLDAADSAYATRTIHQLYLTGDQVYCDEVSDLFMAVIIDAAGWLMGSRHEPTPSYLGPLNPQPWPADGLPKGRDLPAGCLTPWPAKENPDKSAPHDRPWPNFGTRGRIAYAAGLTVDPPQTLAAQEKNPFVLNPTKVGDNGKPETDQKAIDDYTSARNHLMLLGEFYAIMVLSWSPALWDNVQPPVRLPWVNETRGDALVTELGQAWHVDKPTKQDWLLKFKDLATWIRAFVVGLPATRRVLANTPTYMVFDDHDVTDDWYINRDWCDRVLGPVKDAQGNTDTLGRRVIRNGLVCYALFQGWGNTPEQFTIDAAGLQPPGNQLLEQLRNKREMEFDPKVGPSVATLVGVPTGPLPPHQSHTTAALPRAPGSLRWHYRWSVPGWPFEVCVLDCRTVRGYGPGTDSPALLDDGDGQRTNQFLGQLGPYNPDRTRDQVTLVVAQTPVLGARGVEGLQRQFTKDVKGRYEQDAETWSFNESGFENMLTALSQVNSMVVILSGDVHYGFVTSADYWASRPWGKGTSPLANPRTARIVQLVSSAAHNETNDTNKVPLLQQLVPREVIYYGSVTPLKFVGPLDWLSGKTATPSPDLGTSAPVVLKGSEFRGRYGKTVPDWKYRLLDIQGQDPSRAPLPQIPVTATLPAQVNARIKLAGAHQSHALQYLGALADWVIGHNNVAIVTFTGTNRANWHVQQATYWRPDDLTGKSTTPSQVTLFDAALQPRDVP